ncbi:MAG: hypothetical protein WKG03_19825 [Telluria sp.]
MATQTVNSLPVDDADIGPVRRKFMAEAGLHLYSGGATVLRPSDLYSLARLPDFREALAGCNIYLICRRPRISISPHRLRVCEGMIHGEFRVHEDVASYQPYHFVQSKPFLNTDFTPWRAADIISAPSSGCDVRIADSNGRHQFVPAHVLVAKSRHDLGKETSLEVLYVGQGFGKKGERLATDRLSAHSTLQRIMAETMLEKPSDEILLLLFRYEHSRNILSTAGDMSVEPSASSQDEREHMLKSGALHLDRRTRIMLAEATLINYFMPKFNIMHKDSFQPSNTKKLKTLKSLFAHDLTGLIVEINTSDFGSRLYSASEPARTMESSFPPDVIARIQSPGWPKEAGLSTAEVDEFISEMTHAHFARYPLHSKTERESFLHSLPWGQA